VLARSSCIAHEFPYPIPPFVRVRWGVPVATRCAYFGMIGRGGLVETVQMERQYGDWRIPAGCGPASKRLSSPRRSSREVQRREKFTSWLCPNLAGNSETRVNVKGGCLMNLAHVVNRDIITAIDCPGHPTSRSYHSQEPRVGTGRHGSNTVFALLVIGSCFGVQRSTQVLEWIGRVRTLIGTRDVRPPLSECCWRSFGEVEGFERLRE